MEMIKPDELRRSATKYLLWKTENQAGEFPPWFHYILQPIGGHSQIFLESAFKALFPTINLEEIPQPPKKQPLKVSILIKIERGKK